MSLDDSVENIIENFDHGNEAVISLELRTKFPGIGGTIETYQSIPVAKRDEKNPTRKPGHKMFFKHGIIKKLEDYFISTGKYRFAHITRPLGSTDLSYIYEWAHGTEYFPWYYIDNQNNRMPIQLDDWNTFIGAFDQAGISMSHDVCDTQGENAKNLIHELNLGKSYNQPHMNRLWKRIDFGQQSILIDYDKLYNFLENHEINIRTKLKSERFDFIYYANKYLTDRNTMNEKEFEKLEFFTKLYRLSTLSHLNQKGIGYDINNSIEHIIGNEKL